MRALWRDCGAGARGIVASTISAFRGNRFGILLSFPGDAFHLHGLSPPKRRRFPRNQTFHKPACAVRLRFDQSRGTVFHNFMQCGLLLAGKRAVCARVRITTVAIYILHCCCCCARLCNAVLLRFTKWIKPRFNTLFWHRRRKNPIGNGVSRDKQVFERTSVSANYWLLYFSKRTLSNRITLKR